jgi:DNA ligase (NAD+)
MNMTDAQKILALRKELTDHSFRYYVANSPTISDVEYDQKFRELTVLEQEHPEMGDPNSPITRVGCPTPNGLRKIRHKVKMLSLDNINNANETATFFAGLESEEVILEMKIDGLSLHLSYREGQLVQALTRGNGVEGADVTENARTVHSIPLTLRKPVTIEVRGEVYWSLSSFSAYNQGVSENDRLANPRNGASGSMMLKDSREVAKRKLSFAAYSVPSDLPPGVTTQESLLDYLETLGFPTTMTLPVRQDMPGLPYTTCMADADLIPAIHHLDAYRKALDLDTDGLVIKVNSMEKQRDLGEGERAPKWGAAYKFPPDTKETRLAGVLVQVGKTGQVTPVAQLEPVSLGGAVVARASLCNQDELDRLGIDVGDYVLVQRSGEVIPKVVGLARPSPTKKNPNQSYQMPKTCPCCSTPLERPTGLVHSYCVNPECDDQVFARLVYAVSKDALDIDGCGDTTVRQLMDKASVKKLSDLFAIADFSFLKPATARKMREGLAAAKNGPLWRKLSALSIEGIGKTSCQDLATKFSRPINEEDEKQKRLSPLQRIEQYQHEVEELIGKVATAELLTYFTRNIEELEMLADCGFYFEEDQQAGGVLGGKTFCITGALQSGRRDDVSALIEQNGGVVKGQVTKKVDFLVQGTGGGNNKAEGARKHGTRVISEEELYQMMGVPMPVVQKNLEE